MIADFLFPALVAVHLLSFLHAWGGWREVKDLSKGEKVKANRRLVMTDRAHFLGMSVTVCAFYFLITSWLPGSL